MIVTNLPPRVGQYLQSTHYDAINVRIESVIHYRPGGWRCYGSDCNVWWLPDPDITVTDHPVPVPVSE
jgi:hypothetical protein